MAVKCKYILSFFLVGSLDSWKLTCTLLNISFPHGLKLR